PDPAAGRPAGTLALRSGVPSAGGAQHGEIFAAAGTTPGGRVTGLADLHGPGRAPATAAPPASQTDAGLSAAPRPRCAAGDDAALWPVWARCQTRRPDAEKTAAGAARYRPWSDATRAAGCTASSQRPHHAAAGFLSAGYRTVADAFFLRAGARRGHRAI